MAETVALKLLIDKKAERVIFAEAGKDFVDFIFSLLRMPLGSIILLLYGDDDAATADIGRGSLANLYKSIQNFNQAYLQPNADKDSLLEPALAPAASVEDSIVGLLPMDVLSPPPRKFYCCPNYYHYCVAEDRRAVCPQCRNNMTTELKYVLPPEKAGGSGGEGGYVKGMVTYMVMDDLSVTPASMISTVAVLNAANVKEFEALEAKEVEFGVEEGLKLLEACLYSKAALSYVFLGKELKDEEASDGECMVDNPWVNGDLVKKLKECKISNN